MTPTLIEDIASRLSRIAETGPARDFEKNARAALSGLFGRLDLVTREEFEVQQELLNRARTRLEALEARVAQLEAKTGQQ